MRTTLLVISTLVLSANAALAADPSPAGGPRTACRADVEKLCPDVQPGGGRIAACLKKNEAQVSAACKDAIASARQRRAPQAPSSPQG